MARKQAEESEKQEQATYRELEAKRKAFDALLVEQLDDKGRRERLESEVCSCFHRHVEW